MSDNKKPTADELWQQFESMDGDERGKFLNKIVLYVDSLIGVSSNEVITGYLRRVADTQWQMVASRVWPRGTNVSGETLKQIIEMSGRGLSTAQIAKKLNATGHPRPHGDRWTAPAVNKALAKLKELERIGTENKECLPQRDEIPTEFIPLLKSDNEDSNR